MWIVIGTVRGLECQEESWLEQEDNCALVWRMLLVLFWILSSWSVVMVEWAIAAITYS